MSEHHIVPPKTYVSVLGGLIVLMLATIFAAKVHIGTVENLLLALFIAGCKMSLIVAFFMHVKYSSRMTRIFAGAGFFWMILFFVLLFCDYMGRHYGITPIVPSPYGS